MHFGLDLMMRLATLVIKLHMSRLISKGNIHFTNNSVRYIVRAKDMLYFMVTQYTEVTVSYNTMYKIARQDRAYKTDSNPICPIQLAGKFQEDLDFKINCKVVVYNNLHMTSKNLLGEDKSFGNCTWLAGPASHNQKVLNMFIVKCWP